MRQPFFRQSRNYMIPTVNVIRPAMHQDDARRLCAAKFFIGDIQGSRFYSSTHTGALINEKIARQVDVVEMLRRILSIASPTSCGLSAGGQCPTSSRTRRS